ncbi:uncharacterized protein LOC134821594 [Bolinopsis microptera]|uniref:uncharacterized protein LOC134821594 n=1 Tax=Bolinopsis microptera TaxID=2820187 RepID=UPI00307A35FB
MSLLLFTACLLCLTYEVAALNCKKERANEKAINELGLESDDYREWNYVPDCQDKPNDKSWKPHQCKVHKTNKRLKRCKCVESDGTPITDFAAKLNNKKVCSSTKCDDVSLVRDYTYEMMIAQGMIVDAFHFPQCQSRNRKKWAEEQCLMGFIRHCWTVNVKTGERIE